MNIKYYATIGTDTKINAFYNTDVHEPENIPASAIEITEDEWKTFIQKPHQRNGDKWELVPPLTPEELAEIERTRPRTDTEKIEQLETALAESEKRASQAEAVAAQNSTDLQGLMDHLAETGVLV